MSFSCGFGRRNITPPVGTPLYGYRPDLLSESVHDDLTASAVYLAGDGGELIFLSLTLGDISTPMARVIREAAAEMTGVPAKHILCAATHTHSAPNVSGLSGWGDVDQNYVEKILLPAVRDAAREAKATAAPAEVAVRVGESKVGVNRRVRFADGSVDFGQSPWQPYDPFMTVLSFRRTSDGVGITDFVHYGCHGTANGEDTAITRDWSGVMLDRMEDATGTPAVFCNGAMGDVGPRISNGQTTGNISYVEELGEVAARDALLILSMPAEYTSPDLVLFDDTVRLPFQKMPSLAEVEKEIAATPDPENLVYVPALRYKHLCDVRDVLRTTKEADRPKTFDFEVCYFALGDTVFLYSPFEFFSDISMRLRRYTPYRNTLLFSGVNGYECYMPTEDALPLGGYEVVMFRYASPYALADDTDRNMINEALRIVGKSGDYLASIPKF